MFPARVDAAPGSLLSPCKPQVSLLPISGSVKAAGGTDSPKGISNKVATKVLLLLRGSMSREPVVSYA